MTLRSSAKIQNTDHSWFDKKEKMCKRKSERNNKFMLTQDAFIGFINKGSELG
jgi:hypothetical protein